MIRELVLGAGEDWKRHHFTRREVRAEVGWSVTQVRIHLERLQELEYLTPIGGRNGVRFEYRLLLDPKNTEGSAHIGLLETQELRPLPDGKKGKLTGADKKRMSGVKDSSEAA